MALQMNWLIRYINYKYEIFWPLTLDKLFKVNPQNWIAILNYGSEYFLLLIENSKYDIIKSILQNLQNFYREFLTSPESDDNHFIFQSAFLNINIGVNGRKKQKCLTPDYYGWPRDLNIIVNELYKMQHFIDYKQSKERISDKRGNIIITM